VTPGRGRRAAAALKRLDSRPGLVKGTRALRGLLPGDRDYGDPLSVAGSEPSHLIGQRLASATADRPSALREVGMSALQVWQSISEAQGRGRGDRELTILFTDLVGFSDWTLEAGDTQALELLRQVGKVVEPEIDARGGRIVKRLGDGLMATFDDPGEALEAACQASSELDDVEVSGHSPRLRAGLHVGRPRRLGGDFYGVDVNIAARVAAAAGPGEVLISEAARQRLDDGSVTLRRKWRFQAKGAPKELKVYTAKLDA
jgi:adenylate cyclase